HLSLQPVPDSKVSGGQAAGERHDGGQSPMKPPTPRQKTGLAAAGLGLGLLCAWAAWRGQASAATPERILAGIPAPSVPSKTDAAVAKWSEQARRAPKAVEVWVQL